MRTVLGFHRATVEPDKNERTMRGTTANLANAVQYVYDENSHLLGEYTAAGPIVEYVWFGDKPVAAIYGSGATAKLYNIITDVQNTPRRLIDPVNSAIVWAWDGTAYGMGDATGSVTFNLRFPGQYYDAATKQHYNLNRYYNPDFGRYMEPDPIGLEGGLNQYAYAGGNPVSNVDPSGLMSALSDASLSGSFLNYNSISMNNLNWKIKNLNNRSQSINYGNLIALNDDQLRNVTAQGVARNASLAVWTSFNNGVGAIFSGANLALGGNYSYNPSNNVSMITNAPLMSGGAITLGNFQLYSKDFPPYALDNRNGHTVQQHEDQHVIQSNTLGPFYFPFVIGGFATGIIMDGDAHGKHSYSEVGPQKQKPQPWWW